MIGVNHLVKVEDSAVCGIFSNNLRCKDVVDAASGFASWYFRRGSMLVDEEVFKVEAKHTVCKVDVVGWAP